MWSWKYCNMKRWSGFTSCTRSWAIKWRSEFKPHTSLLALFIYKHSPRMDLYPQSSSPLHQSQAGSGWGPWMTQCIPSPLMGNRLSLQEHILYYWSVLVIGHSKDIQLRKWSQPGDVDTAFNWMPKARLEAAICAHSQEDYLPGALKHQYNKWEE